MSQGRERGRGGPQGGNLPPSGGTPSTLILLSAWIPASHLPTCCRAWDLLPPTRRPLPPPGSAQREGRGPGLVLEAWWVSFLSSPPLESRGSEARPSTSRRPAPRLTHRPRDARQAGIHVPPPARLALRAQARTHAHTLGLRASLSAPNAQAIRTPEAGPCPRCPPQAGRRHAEGGWTLTPPLLSPLPTHLALPTSFQLPLSICPPRSLPNALPRSSTFPGSPLLYPFPALSLPSLHLFNDILMCFKLSNSATSGAFH